MAYIQFDNIYKSFGDNEVIKGVTLGVEKGQLVTLLGPSGCGKSTLLRCLAGLESVTKGKIFMDSVDITNVDPRRRNIGMVFQQYSLFPNMTVGQNVAFGLKIKKMEKNAIKDKVDEVLNIVGLSEKINQYPIQLSGGQQQRVALARAIVMEPRVLLLDEPLSAIDALLRRNLQLEIRRIQQQLKITTIFVTHDQEEAMVMSDTIYLLNDGNIEQSGTAEQIYAHPKTKFAASFIGHYNVLTIDELEISIPESKKYKNVAIRPEAIKILKLEPDKSDNTVLRGKVISGIIHGNTVRYSIKTNKNILSVDVLYDPTVKFASGEEVFLTINKLDLVFIP